MPSYTVNPNERNVLFPVFFKLHELELLIVGGGYVGWEKLQAVLRNSPDARVTLVAEELRNPEILKLAEAHPHVQVIERAFKKKDLKGKDLVILATDNPKLHKKIKKKAKKRHLLTNVADTPQLCDFYLSSVVQKGNLKVAISTNGKSPTLAKRLRENLEDVLPDEIDSLLDRLQEIRNQLKGDFEAKVEALDNITADFMVKKDKAPKQ